MTAYNPAIIALNNMLREQIRLVEQFVEINQRMYESYAASANSSYRYTTLEDTRKVCACHARNLHSRVLPQHELTLQKDDANSTTSMSSSLPVACCRRLFVDEREMHV